ncbi:hypothetical protein BDA96_03G123200 [Sorghum bicolor]|uniref:WAT1-related protein n=2 Tax=Sorghum bicolor TaxID=4558 RepID=A0A921RB17_SORBI|nr:hypothetical protein BDA96_03G123200 [Sorghum bicolor]OQU86628.1 hypothetical protein SORBI_3003G118332 [Sorghum bicolor]
MDSLASAQAPPPPPLSSPCSSVWVTTAASAAAEAPRRAILSSFATSPPCSSPATTDTGRAVLLRVARGRTERVDMELSRLPMRSRWEGQSRVKHLPSDGMGVHVASIEPGGAHTARCTHRPYNFFPKLRPRSASVPNPRRDCIQSPIFMAVRSRAASPMPTRQPSLETPLVGSLWKRPRLPRRWRCTAVLPARCLKKGPTPSNKEGSDQNDMEGARPFLRLWPCRNLYIAGIKFTSTTFASATTKPHTCDDVRPCRSLSLRGAGDPHLVWPGQGGRDVARHRRSNAPHLVQGADITPWRTQVNLVAQLHHHQRDGHGDATTNYTLGTVLCVSSCFFYALWLVVQAKLSSEYPFHYSSTALMCAMTALQSAVFALCFKGKVNFAPKGIYPHSLTH